MSDKKKQLGGVHSGVNSFCLHNEHQNHTHTHTEFPVLCLEQATDSPLLVSERVRIKDAITVAGLRS